MSTPTPSKPSPSLSTSTSSTTPQANASNMTISPEFVYKAAWGAVIVCPLLIIAPPRKLDMYTFGLLVTTVIGANHIRTERTGYGFIDGYAQYAKGLSATVAPLPAAALETQKRLRLEREQRRGRWESTSRVYGGAAAGEKGKGEGEGEREEGAADGQSEEDGEQRGILERLWMGTEGNDWIEKRKKEEEEALAQGKSYAEIMGGFIWEAWSGGKRTEEEAKAREARELISRSWEEEKRKKSEAVDGKEKLLEKGEKK